MAIWKDLMMTGLESVLHLRMYIGGLRQLHLKVLPLRLYRQ